MIYASLSLGRKPVFSQIRQAFSIYSAFIWSSLSILCNILINRASIESSSLNSNDIFMASLLFVVLWSIFVYFMGFFVYFFACFVYLLSTFILHIHIDNKIYNDIGRQVDSIFISLHARASFTAPPLPDVSERNALSLRIGGNSRAQLARYRAPLERGIHPA